MYVIGEAERERVHAAVPLWRLLRLLEAEGAGVQEHRLDLRMRRAEAQSKDRQLHSHILNSSIFKIFKLKLKQN